MLLFFACFNAFYNIAKYHFSTRVMSVQERLWVDKDNANFEIAAIFHTLSLYGD